MKIKWPKTITNEKLYKLTRTEPWSTTIRRRRLKWTGHLLRMDEQTPARRSLKEVLRPTKNKVGRPPLTWPRLIIKDIQETKLIDIKPTEKTHEVFLKLENLAQNRPAYRAKINCCIPQRGWLRK